MTSQLVTLIIAVLGKFMSDEVKAWFGWLTRKIRHIAVAKLPEAIRERYNEEWESDVEEVPGEIFRLFYSLGLLRAARAIRESARADASLPLLKRLFDIGFAFSTLILMAPLILALSIAIKLTSRGPILIALPRLGRGGIQFGRLRFRIIAQTGAEFRVTRVGHLLRGTALDELPVLLNVLRGDMSITGPPAFPPGLKINADSPRANLTPGIIDYEDQPEMPRPWSIWRDLKALLRCGLSVLRPPH